MDGGGAPFKLAVTAIGMKYSNTTLTATRPPCSTRSRAAAGTDVAATVYCDSLTLDSDVLEVIAPVMVADRYELTPVDGISAIRYWQYEDGYGDYGRGFWRSQRRSRQARGTFAYQPQAYFVDTYLREDMSSAEPALRMRVAPMPNTSMVIQYRAKIEPPRVYLQRRL